MIRDRGHKKWQGMMLTEHTNLLKAWKQENKYVTQPILEEWELSLIAEEIERAHRGRCYVKITIWEEGNFYDYYGYIIEVTQQSLLFESLFETISCKLEKLVKVSMIG